VFKYIVVFAVNAIDVMITHDHDRQFISISRSPSIVGKLTLHCLLSLERCQLAMSMNINEALRVTSVLRFELSLGFMCHLMRFVPCAARVISESVIYADLCAICVICIITFAYRLTILYSVGTLCRASIS